jgi:hypothetical protein
VDLIGIEPMTSSMPWKRAPSCATGPLWGMQLFYCLRLGMIRQTRIAPKSFQIRPIIMRANGVTAAGIISPPLHAFSYGFDGPGARSNGDTLMLIPAKCASCNGTRR